jgi:DMSO reductase anchor subunit
MTLVVSMRTEEMIAPKPQGLWGWPAVANFALGSLGAGWYIAAVLAAGFERTPGVRLASWVAPALVLAGFAAVATEAGRPFRGLRVPTRLRTSWMSREALIGGAFVLLVIADLAFPLRLHRAQALVAAALLPLVQGFIVRRARGVIAWDVPIMPVLFVASAALSGVGAVLLVEGAAGRPVTGAGPAVVLGLVVVSLDAWARYRGWSSDETYLRATAPLRRRRTKLLVDGAGHGAPFLLVILTLLVPGAAGPALALAGALLIAGQAYTKACLVRDVGLLRPITLRLVHPRRTTP